MEDSNDDVDINRACDTVIENIKYSAKEILDQYELKKLKPLFNKGYSKQSDKREKKKQIAMVTGSTANKRG
jgi:hypothetical protein